MFGFICYLSHYMHAIRQILLVLLLGVGSIVSAQNVQVHYDFGRYVYPEVQSGRPIMTATVEQKGPDKYGDTFYFVDMNFQSAGAVQANWKFLRNIRFWKAPVSWHIRYDGGLRFIKANDPNPSNSPAVILKDAFFTGATYHYFSADRKLMLNVIGAYKYIKGHVQPHNWEGTLVWNYTPGQGLFNATGFATLWREKDIRLGWDTEYKFMSQPQFWFNLNKLRGVSSDFKLSIGSEVRISKNVDAPQWLVVPTLALRWSFGK